MSHFSEDFADTLIATCGEEAQSYLNMVMVYLAECGLYDREPQGVKLISMLQDVFTDKPDLMESIEDVFRNAFEQGEFEMAFNEFIGYMNTAHNIHSQLSGVNEIPYVPNTREDNDALFAKLASGKGPLTNDDIGDDERGIYKAPPRDSRLGKGTGVTPPVFTPNPYGKTGSAGGSNDHKITGRDVGVMDSPENRYFAALVRAMQKAVSTKVIMFEPVGEYLDRRTPGMKR